MDDGFDGDVPFTAFVHGASGAVGDNSRLALRGLDGVARASARKVLRRHHQRETMYVGIVDNGKGAVDAIVGKKSEQRVAGLERDCGIGEAIVGIGPREVERAPHRLGGGLGLLRLGFGRATDRCGDHRRLVMRLVRACLRRFLLFGGVVRLFIISRLRLLAAA